MPGRHVYRAGVGRDRDRVQLAARIAALGFVVAWLFSAWLQARVPWWLAFVALVATELEFVVRARLARDRERTVTAETRAPGPDDADLGWGTLVEGDAGVEWLPPPTRTPRRRRQSAAVVTGAVAAVLVVLAIRADARGSWDDLSSAEQRTTTRLITTESGRIAGRPVRVECDRGFAFTGAESDALGVAFPARGIAFVHPAICRAIHDLSVGDRVRDDEAGEALVVVAHEAVHLAGTRDEGLTECRALQRGVELGIRLGISPETAARLMRSRYAQALAERNVVRAAYALPRGCAEDGQHDLTPGDGRFP